MFNAVEKSVDRLVSEFSLRRLFGLITFVLLVVAGAILFEWYTSSFRLARLERAMAVLGALEEGVDTPADSVRIAQLRENLLDELESALSAPPVSLTLPQIPELRAPGLNVPSAMKFLATAVLWWGFGLLGHFTADPNSDGATGLVGFGVLGIVAGLVAAWVPTWAWPWFNLAFVPILTLGGFVALVIVTAGGRGRRSSSG